MDAVLLGITAVSLLIALGMSLVAWRTVRNERVRATARIAALSIDESAPAAAPPPTRPGVPVEPVRAPWTPAPPVTHTTRVSPRRQARRLVPGTIAAARARGPAPDLDLRVDHGSQELPLRSSSFEPSPQTMPEDAVPRDFLGGAASTSGSTRQRGLALAVAVLLVALVVLGISTFTGTRATPTELIALSHDASLQLLSLRHERTGDRLSIVGLIRNPAAGAPVDKLTAVVSLFDRDGTLVRSAVAPVDFLHLRPGDETPFVLTVNAPASVARYRVSFRTADGVVPHVDRRGTPSVQPGVAPEPAPAAASIR